MPIIYIILGLIINAIISSVIDKYLGRKTSTRGKDKRKDTIINLGKNIFKYLILIFVVLGILKLYGVDTTSIIASLGVFAAVIGLAFQDIVKDFLAGIAIIFDNKYAVGDVIEINGFKGTVISLGLRSTKIKAFTGEIKCISNSKKLEKVLESLRQTILKIEDVKDYSLLGVDELGDSSIVYMVDITCKAMTGVGVKRQALRIIKDKFDAEGISIPYTTVDINIRK